MRLAAALAPCALLGVLGWTHRWNSDDAFINFRVVDHLLHGQGPVFNFGERVEAYTSALWVGVLAAGSAVLGIERLPWVAVVGGLALTVGGLAAATWAAVRLHADRGGSMVPLGALAFAVLPPAWDFATSGLETGLGFAWLGATFAVLVAGERRAGLLDVAAFLAGLGVLVRPDFAVFTVAFVVVVVALSPRPAARAAPRALAFALPAPLLYELFRAGYFAALVPNTALAKEAGDSRWGQGWDYAWDTLGTYWLWLPLAALLGWLAFRLRARALVWAALPAAGALHLLYVMRVGGDFMHGRMLLPGLFAMLLPVAAVPVRRRAADLLLAAAVIAWAVVCAATLRTDYDETPAIAASGVADERAVYASMAGHEHPVTLDDYSGHGWAQAGAAVHQRAAAGHRVVTFGGPNLDPPPPDTTLAGGTTPAVLVAPAANVGLFGYAAGRDVHVVDRHGLADPVAARLRLDIRGRPGHEKHMPPSWVLARFARAGGTPEERAAARALGCGDLEETLRAVTEPTNLGRFLSRIGFALTSTRLRFDADPRAAARELC